MKKEEIRNYDFVNNPMGLAFVTDTSSLIPQGSFRAKAVSSVMDQAESSEKPYLTVLFEIVGDGPFAGKRLRWLASFHGKTEEQAQKNADRVRKSLAAMGFSASSMAEWEKLTKKHDDASKLFPLEVEIVTTWEHRIEPERRDRPDDPAVIRTGTRVLWINKLLGLDDPKRPLDAQRSKDFAASMFAMGSIGDTRPSSPAKTPAKETQTEDDDIPF
jgi:hypothetical protein